ncbi:MAG: FG-GAP repeat protein [Planctomycetes bacterium]|nr:FG-GAP repeat protein [Planctomycetota bacterium]
MVQYPLTIDPVAQQAYLKASNTDASDGFGNGVAISGNTVVVGAPFEDSNASGVNGNQADNSASNSGAAYVFVRDGSNWSQQAYLKRSPSALSGTYFGATVAISGDTIVVGAWNEGSGSGSIHVFFRTGTTWIQQASLKASNQQSADRFGKSIAISGDTIVAGAYNEDSDATGVDGNQANNNAWHAGAAYVFVRSASTWTQQAYLKASNTDAADEFGFSVGISNDTIVVGARFEHSSATGVNGNQSDNIATNSGAAYVFVRSGSTWTQQAYLKASNTDLHDNFGSSIAISGETIVVGAPSEDSNATGINGNQANNSAVGSGAAYVFVRSGGIWSQQAYLKASNTGNSDGFGVSVAISSEIVAVGAWQEDSSATGVNGDQLNNSASNSGAAYIFERDGTSWTQTAYLKASQTGADDLFGTLVAISGGLVVIGAIGEDSSATGVNGNQANNSAASSGAVYIFDLDDNAGTASYGTGTSGCAGTHTLGVTHAPMINSPHFGITCNNAPPSSLGLGILANAQDSAGSDPFGIGALLHVDLFASTEVITLDFFSDAQGNGLAAAPIPNAPTLVGNTYYAMALWAWTTCSLPPFNLSSSQGLSMTVLVP